jgi:MFS family permease
LTRDFVLGFFALFTFAIAFHVLIPTLPIYLSRLGSKESEIGVLIGIFFASSLVFRPLVGKALLRVRERDFMIAGAILFGLTSIAYLLVLPFWPFLIVRVFQGIALAFFHTAAYTLIVNISPEAHRGQSLSYFLLAPTISLAIAPSLGMFLINHFSFTFLFLACSGISLCSLLITNKLGRRQVSPPEDAFSEEGFFLRWKVLPASIVSFFNFIAWGALTAFFPLYAINHGVANPGVFFTVIAVMLISGRIFGGKVLDLYRRERVIPAFLTLHVISMTLLAFSTNLPMFILVAVIWGIGASLLIPAVMAYTLDRAGPSRGPAVGTLTALSDLGLALGPVIMGIIIRLSNYRTMFLCVALTLLINLGYFHFLVRKKG